MVDRVGHHDLMTCWERPYSLDTPTALAYAQSVLVTGLAVAVIRSGWLYPLILLVPALAVSVRTAMVGLFVSEKGVRSRGFFVVATVEWNQIADIRSGYVSYFGAVTGRRCIVLDLVDGTTVQTPIRMRLPRRLFMVNERYDIAGASTNAAHYDYILQTLQHLLGEHGGSVATPAPARPAVAAADNREQLHTLERLRQRGSITDDEYARLRGQFER